MNYQLDNGKYLKTLNGKTLKVYQVWNSMKHRCYNAKYHERYPTYADCSMCEDWKDFQVFAKWFYDNYYEIPNEKMCLDKDLLVKGNTVYSPETCVFIPQRINLLLTNRKLHRGELPLGVVFCKQTGKYMSHCKNEFGKFKTIGRYNSSQEAFHSYKAYKENVIRSVANTYKNVIPKSAYDSLMEYEVENDVLS